MSGGAGFTYTISLSPGTYRLNVRHNPTGKECPLVVKVYSKSPGTHVFKVCGTSFFHHFSRCLPKKAFRFEQMAVLKSNTNNIFLRILALSAYITLKYCCTIYQISLCGVWVCCLWLKLYPCAIFWLSLNVAHNSQTDWFTSQTYELTKLGFFIYS